MVKLESFCPEERTTDHSCFFKIILPKRNTQHLRIPPMFVKRLSKESFKRLILEDPNGKHWNVKLCKTANGTYIKDGWETFVKEHSLWNYEFLTFRYDGAMCLKVTIFDKSGCVRDYTFQHEPISPIGRNKHDPDEPISPVGRVKHDPDEPISPLSKKRGRGRPPKKSAAASTKPCLWTPSNARQWNSEFQASRARPSNMNEEQKELWKAVKYFTSSLPYLVKPLGLTNLSLYIPVDFSKEYLPQSCKNVILQNLKDKAWIVEAVVDDKGYTRFAKGWKDFIVENGLKKGDICIFELVSKYEFRVHTFRLVKGRVCVPCFR